MGLLEVVIGEMNEQRSAEIFTASQDDMGGCEL